MQDLTLMYVLLVIIVPLILAVTIHEAAHGLVANQLGDHTARSLGRISLNPINHIDWIGTVLVPIMMISTTGVLFGWAKPVPVNPGNLKNPRLDMALVAIAGPAINLVMALLWALILFGITSGSVMLPGPFSILEPIAAAGVFINTILMVLNLLPLPPLDGGRVVVGLLPERLAMNYAKIEPLGIPILILLLLFSPMRNYLPYLIRATVEALPSSAIVLKWFPV